MESEFITNYKDVKMEEINNTKAAKQKKEK